MSTPKHCPNCGARGLSRSRRRLVDVVLEKAFKVLPYRCVSCGNRRYLRENGRTLRSILLWVLLIALFLTVIIVGAFSTVAGLFGGGKTSEAQRRYVSQDFAKPSYPNAAQDEAAVRPALQMSDNINNTDQRFAQPSDRPAPIKPTTDKTPAAKSAVTKPRQPAQSTNKPQSPKPIRKPVPIYRLEDIVGEYDGFSSRVGIFATKPITQYKILSQTRKRLELFFPGRWTLESGLPRRYPIGDRIVTYVSLEPASAGLRVILNLTGSSATTPRLKPFNGGLILTLTPRG